MNELFVGYYQPSEAETSALWKDATFVLDTNVLLNLYRYPQQARDDLFSVLEKVAERLWVPFHVALEYQRNRVNVIAGENAKFDSTVKQLNRAETELEQAIDKLELEKRGLGIKTEPLTSALKKAIAAIRTSVDNAKGKQLSVSHRDEVRDRLDKILGDRVGAPPKDQGALDALLTDGKTRYEKNIPPGFKDLGKIKNPAESKFYHDGIEYPAEFGDLIIWRQVLAHVNDANIKHLIFVTGDRKEDWWAREHGQTLGPLPELSQEMRRLAGVETFWMYTADQFLERASKELNTPIDQASVTEVRDVVSEAAAKNAEQLSRLAIWQDLSEDNRAARQSFLKVYHDYKDSLNRPPETAGNRTQRSVGDWTAWMEYEALSIQRKALIEVAEKQFAEWVARQAAPHEAVLIERGQWPTYRLVSDTQVRGLHLSIGAPNSYVYDLARCNMAMQTDQIQAMTIVFLELPKRFSFGEDGYDAARKAAMNFPNITCIFAAIDDSLELEIPDA